MSKPNIDFPVRAIFDLSVEYARGTFKKVYKGKYMNGPRNGQSCVCKVFITGSVYEKSYFQHELDVVCKAAEIVRTFNEHNFVDKKILINQPQIWKFVAGNRDLALVEPMIDNFEKFNSNTGWAQDKTAWGQVMQALTHFSFHLSGGQIVLCDLQGGVYSDCVVLTDPVVMSTNRRFGTTDLGKIGIDSFFYYHICNKYCRSEWIKPFRKKEVFSAIKGTTMI